MPFAFCSSAARFVHHGRLVANGARDAGENDVVGVDAIERVDVDRPRRIRELLFLRQHFPIVVTVHGRSLAAIVDRVVGATSPKVLLRFAEFHS
jgi:hypothetical protein